MDSLRLIPENPDDSAFQRWLLNSIIKVRLEAILVSSSIQIRFASSLADSLKKNCSLPIIGDALIRFEQQLTDLKQLDAIRT